MELKDYITEHQAEIEAAQTQPGDVHLKILPYLNIERGVFVEAGALDGLFMSNTKILEDCGWTGLLVEPSPEAATKCSQNRTAIVERCALVSADYKDKYIEGDFLFDGSDGLGAWSSIDRFSYGIRQDTKKGIVFHPFLRKVPALTLTDILNHHQLKKVDFLSLDVEGYELEVLKGLDLKQIAVSYILIEVNLDKYSLEDIQNILKDYDNLGKLTNFASIPGDYSTFHEDYLFKKHGL